MRARRPAKIIVLLFVALFAMGTSKCEKEETGLPGLAETVKVVTDHDGVPHLFAKNDADLARAQGYVHCRDRFFQMDVTRRQVDGTSAELFGPSALGGDVEARVFGLHRAAQRSLDAAPQRFQDLLQAYADGVNHCLDTLPLPPEYALLELTKATVNNAANRWTPVDSLAIGKAISASLSLDIDTGLTQTYASYVQAGVLGGFDGEALFSQDVYRSAPMDPASTVPDATNGTPYAAAPLTKARTQMIARAGAAAKRTTERLERSPLLAAAMKRRENFVGSNEWGVAGSETASGRPIIANDPHLSLNIPSTFYEWRLSVEDDPVDGRMNVSGVGFPGAPGVILGQNDDVTWGATTNPMDVTDVFQDELHVFTPPCLATGAFVCIVSEGTFHPADVAFPTYQANLLDGTDDTVVDVTGSVPIEGQIVVTIPFRSFGPVIDIEDLGVIDGGGVTNALVLQYTGFHATQELQTFVLWNRAHDLGDFLAGLEKFDVGSQNWAYADRDGNLAYFSSAELPLRTDLENGAVVGLPPFFIRDGSGPNNWIADPAHSQGQTIPYAILPYAEMPQTVNPPNGFFVNANNDPAGTSLDNDPLNQFRTGNPGAIYYLNPGYAAGLRAGRITQLVRDAVEAPGRVSTHDMRRFQANTQQLDAEIMVPFILAAFDNASAPGAPAELAALSSDPDVQEAAGRLAAWDFSTPTGIPEGYDASDHHGERMTQVPSDEAEASVAATIYNMWRGIAIGSIVDARLASLGVGAGSTEALKALHHFLDQTPYTGVAAAGVEWIPEPAALSAEERRDLALLQALRGALDRLASNALAPAFGNSTNQDDYRWGRLHRITFDHPFENAFDVPPQAGFEDLAPDLPGLSRDGGYNVVNASGFSARATGVNSFRFGGGPVRRYVGGPSFISALGMIGWNVMPGGPSGIPDSPDYATQLGTWLTADYHFVNMSPIVLGDVEKLVPPAP